ncbi:hypothetical protein [Saccharothrix algeriensis]|uniref:Uncharacterized protein n=1 Tax=Saccharothrix algeriensis TaxID=173560 RepID=A0ABS2S0G4_9PSEU|nr:hypothetical protein [Saccharothrix algeriensis]
MFGNLYVTEKVDGADFTADDEVVLTALAAGAGAQAEGLVGTVFAEAASFVFGRVGVGGGTRLTWRVPL